MFQSRASSVRQDTVDDTNDDTGHFCTNQKARMKTMMLIMTTMMVLMMTMMILMMTPPFKLPMTTTMMMSIIMFYIDAYDGYDFDNNKNDVNHNYIYTDDENAVAVAVDDEGGYKGEFRNVLHK